MVRLAGFRHPLQVSLRPAARPGDVQVPLSLADAIASLTSWLHRRIREAEEGLAEKSPGKHRPGPNSRRDACLSLRSRPAYLCLEALES